MKYTHYTFIGNRVFGFYSPYYYSKQITLFLKLYLLPSSGENGWELLAQLDLLDQ
jgi:hypothetical protein